MAHDPQSAAAPVQAGRVWRRLLSPKGLMALVVLIVLIMTWPRLAPSVLTMDAGDLQIACSVWGIAHPPGYVGYTTLGHWLTRLFFFVEPAYVISVACMALMIFALVQLMRCMMDARVAPVIAAGAVLLLCMEKNYIWHSLVEPEVYAPSMAILITVIYGMCCASDQPRTAGGVGRLFSAAALYGFLVVSRPSAVLYLPGILLSWWLHARGRGVPMRSRMVEILQLVGIGTASGLLILVLLWIRDVPSNPYNHMVENLAHHDDLPAWDGTWATKLDRVIWIASAKEYHKMARIDWSKFRQRWRWTRRQLGIYDSLPFYGALSLLISGSLALAKWRRWQALIHAWNLILPGAAFVVLYNVTDQAADLMPTLFGATWLIAAAATHVTREIFGFMAAARGGLARRIAWAALCAGGAALIRHGWMRYNFAETRDASKYLREMDLATLPPNSRLFGSWPATRPLIYENLLHVKRDDLTIVGFHDPASWWTHGASTPERPVYYLERDAVPEGWRLVPYRNIYRVEENAVEKNVGPAVRTPGDQSD